MPVVIFLGSVALGVMGMWAIAQGQLSQGTGKPPPVATPAPPTTGPGPSRATGTVGTGATTTATPPPGPAAPSHVAVKFSIRSEPDGATVSVDGTELGETPLDFNRAPGDDGTATAEVVLTKSGYDTLTITAAGSGDVLVSQKLRKKAAPPPPPPKKKSNAPGYKDDPYQ